MHGTDCAYYNDSDDTLLEEWKNEETGKENQASESCETAIWWCYALKLMWVTDLVLVELTYADNVVTTV